MQKGFGIVGIGTDVGKTVVSAIITEALGACYFKPIQAGDLDNSDSIKIGRWCPSVQHIYPEVFRLQRPMAPHAAAALEQQSIEVKAITIPECHAPLVLEGAGGIFVPLNEKGETIADIHLKSKLPVIVVSRNYLGSINHTLLTIHALKAKNIPIKGIIYVDEPSKHSEEIIEKITGIQKLGNIELVEDIDAAFIKAQANKFSFLRYEL